MVVYCDKVNDWEYRSKEKSAGLRAHSRILQICT